MRDLLNLPIRILDSFRKFDFLAPLAIRLYLIPIFVIAAAHKIDLSTGLALESTVQWFGNEQWGLGLPFPELMTYLAGYTELLGALSLALGFGVRLFAVPLMITMLVAGYTAHWENGWAAISPGEYTQACIQGTEAHNNAGIIDRIKCYNVSDRTIGGVDRLSKAKSILKQHGNYSYLTEKGSLVMLNNGIEFATTYFIMLLVLFFMGAGRFVSLDYYIRLFGMDD